MSTTQSMRKYLATIYHLQEYESNLQVRATDLARGLCVSAPAVTRMLQRLEERKLIVHGRYEGDIELTIEGAAEAAKRLRWLRILECFAFDVLGFDWDQTSIKASQLVNGVDDEIIEKMATALDAPKLSPYGEQIPPFEQLMSGCLADTCILNLTSGSSGVVTRIRTPIHDVKAQLAEIGISSGTSYKIVGRAPFSGPMTLEIDEQQQRLDRHLTTAVWVKPNAPKG
jgi:DtxR family Mn-dependent transcriptional regulator